MGKFRKVWELWILMHELAVNFWKTVQGAWSNVVDAPALVLAKISTHVFQSLVMLLVWSLGEPCEKAYSKTDVDTADHVGIHQLT